MTIIIDTVSEPGAWARAIDRGCLADVVARCKGRGATDRSHPDPVFAGVIPLIPVHAEDMHHAGQ